MLEQEWNSKIEANILCRVWGFSRAAGSVFISSPPRSKRNNWTLGALITGFAIWGLDKSLMILEILALKEK